MRVGGVHFRSQNGSKIAFQTAARPQDGPRQLQDAPGRFQEAQRRPQDAPRRPQSDPKTAPRRPQDAPRRPQDAPRRRTKVTKTQSKSQPPPDLNFFRFWGRFWRVLGWIFGGTQIDFQRILRKICRAFGRLAIQDRQRKPSKTLAKPQ